MRKVVYLLLALLLFLLVPPGATALQTGTMRCRNGIVSTGDTIADVLSKCGPPVYQDRREETHASGQRYGYNRSFQIVTVDDWTYNFGPQEFMYQVIFQNGRVYLIESRDQGF